jgi:septum formation topological specificity factor MinE
MLLAFNAKNYRSIKDEQSLSLVGTSLKGPHDPINVSVPSAGNGVLPCAIIYGPNASGKSNLIDAISRLKSLVLESHFAATTDEAIQHDPFLLDEDGNGIETEFKASFIVGKVRYDLKVSFDSVSIIEETLFSYPEGRRRKLYERLGKEISFGPAMKGAKKSLFGFTKQNVLFLSTASQNDHPELSLVVEFFRDIFTSKRIAVPTNLMNAMFGKNEIDVRTIRFLEVIGTGVISYRQTTSEMPDDVKEMRKGIVELLNRHVGSNPSDDRLKLDEKRFEVELGHRGLKGQSHFFTGELESAGTRRLLVLMNEIFKVLDSGGLAIVDELDASLHSVAVEAIISLFTDIDFNPNMAQLIATTHDTNLLNPDQLRRDEIWFVEKNFAGFSEYFSLAEIVSRKGESFEKSYLQGRYGALPPKFDRNAFEYSDVTEQPLEN